ncbi:MAG: DinB family protein [Friedmanniella sp.]|nr:DinB family protein [Friedmanniella sp.]
MSDDPTQTLLRDSFGRVAELVRELTADLSLPVSTYRPDPEANSAGWLLWHLIRITDDHVAALAGVDQAWPDWRARFDLPYDPFETGYGQSPEEVGSLRVSGALLAGYHADVHLLTTDYLDRLVPAELDRVVDRRWDPPVTAGVRLVSVLGDALQHLGQAAYVVGLAQRAGLTGPETPR